MTTKRGNSDQSESPAPRRPYNPLDKARFGTIATSVALAEIAVSSQYMSGAGEHLLELLRELQPRDRIEQMFLEQMAVTHARVIRLSAESIIQTDETWRRQLSEEYERAANLFRRQMLAFAEYRQPRRSVTVQQANIAAQQIVQQRIESGPHPEDRDEKALSTERERPKQLQRTIHRNQPWLQSTGPRSEEGKRRSALNAVRHGLRSAKFLAEKRGERAALRTVEAMAKGGSRT